MQKEYHIKEKEFEKLYILSDRVFKLSCVSSKLCHSYFEDIVPTNEIIPVVDFLKKEASRLNSYFIEMSQ